jgi:hypothetical protein
MLQQTGQAQQAGGNMLMMQAQIHAPKAQLRCTLACRHSRQHTSAALK